MTPEERIIVALDAGGFLRTERAHTRAVALVAGVLAAVEAETKAEHEPSDRVREGLRAQAQRARDEANRARNEAVDRLIEWRREGRDDLLRLAVRRLLESAAADQGAERLQDLSNGHV